MAPLPSRSPRCLTPGTAAFEKTESSSGERRCCWKLHGPWCSKRKKGRFGSTWEFIGGLSSLLLLLDVSTCRKHFDTHPTLLIGSPSAQKRRRALTEVRFELPGETGEVCILEEVGWLGDICEKSHTLFRKKTRHLR